MYVLLVIETYSFCFIPIYFLGPSPAFVDLCLLPTFPVHLVHTSQYKFNFKVTIQKQYYLHKRFIVFSLKIHSTIEMFFIVVVVVV